jgi:hypothetical protein
MVRVVANTADPCTAWRVRDALAAHPLLGGATAHITISATLTGVLLEGWTVDEEVLRLAQRLAQRAAGRQMVEIRLHSRPALRV